MGGEDLIKCPACGKEYESLSAYDEDLLEKSLIEGDPETLNIVDPDLVYQCDCGCEWTQRINRTIRKADQNQEQVPREGQTLTSDREDRDEDEDEKKMIQGWT